MCSPQAKAYVAAHTEARGKALILTPPLSELTDSGERIYSPTNPTVFSRYFRGGIGADLYHGEIRYEHCLAAARHRKSIA